MPGCTVEEARLFTDPARAEVDMVFQFEHVSLDQGASKWDVHPLRLVDLKASLGRWQAGLAEVGWNSLYWNNHDQPRAVSRFGDDGEYRVRSAKLLGTLLHLHRGTPYVYQGEELGMTNAPFEQISDFRDIESINHFAEAVAAGQSPDSVLIGLRTMGRDNARTPVQWDDSANAGFTTGEPWIPANPNYHQINAAAALADPDSVWHHYRALIDLRHREPAVAHGDFTMLLPEHEQIYAFTRRLDDVELLVLANVSGRTAIADQIPFAAQWENSELLLTNAARSGTVATAAVAAAVGGQGVPPGVGPDSLSVRARVVRGAAVNADDAAEAEVAGGAADAVSLPGGRPVAVAVGRRAQVRAALGDPPVVLGQRLQAHSTPQTGVRSGVRAQSSVHGGTGPLPDVADHVEQAEPVGREPLHR